MTFSDIETILKHFNTGRRKKLSYRINGNKVDVLWGHNVIAENLTISTAYCFIWGFTSGRARK